MKRFVFGATVGLAFGVVLGLVPWMRSSDFACYAVWRNKPELLRLYFLLGGNSNLRTAKGSLVYIATGPDGGNAVLAMLLQHGADPNLGLGHYTPLMNAASWCALDAVRMLIAAHANPRLRNERGETAIETTCAAPAPEAALVSDYLRGAMAGLSQSTSVP
jgi:hypothetical protein